MPEQLADPLPGDPVATASAIWHGGPEDAQGWPSRWRSGRSSPQADHAGSEQKGEGERLRGYDSVHLAAALAVADDELVLVTGDTELATAAMSAGIAVAPSTR